QLLVCGLFGTKFGAGCEACLFLNHSKKKFFFLLLRKKVEPSKFLLFLDSKNLAFSDPPQNFHVFSWTGGKAYFFSLSAGIPQIFSSFLREMLETIQIFRVFLNPSDFFCFFPALEFCFSCFYLKFPEGCLLDITSLRDFSLVIRFDVFCGV